ncbi:MAG: PAS domain-containing sensor histidine kinase [Rubrivivax sp.]|jgi:two-component system sensor histidine kinase DctS
MTAHPTNPPDPVRVRRVRRAVLWTALVVLLLVAQSLLVWLTLAYESSRLQEEAENVATDAATEVRRELLLAMQNLQAGDEWGIDARRHPGLLRLELRDAERRLVRAWDSPMETPLFQYLPRASLETDVEVACALARRTASPAFSRSYYVPLASGRGIEVIDLCVPWRVEGREAGVRVATFGLGLLLEGPAAARGASRYELSFVEGDGTRLARAGRERGRGTYVADRVLDLPGSAVTLRADNSRGRPSLIPNLTVALVLGLSLALFALLLLLARDMRRRSEAERALAEALSFRKAMEDSLITGLRARDLDGRITYANPAFCAMTGFSPEELRTYPPPYWPPEHVGEYQQRQTLRLDLSQHGTESREGFETVFMRRSGERFPVMIYEAPLVDSEGRHAGWMSAVVDASAQRRVEELSRQQQDRLQASARLATVGEMASLISHELNQPLAAIASYASGSLNLLQDGLDAQADRAMLEQALSRIAEQAERAGRVIKSVHDFVRRRQQHHEAVRCDVLIEGVLPLVRLQARKSGTRVEVDLPDPVPRVQGDRTMLEQVLLNLARNGIQAMETATAPEARELVIRVRTLAPQQVRLSVIDRGPGIGPEVAARLFTPFFTTRPEGMGLGLSLCRTVIEQHGGTLEYGPPDDGTAGTEFRFTLAGPRQVEPAAAAAAAAVSP